MSKAQSDSIVAKLRNLKSNRLRWIGTIIFLIGAVPTLLFGLRSYGSFRLLQSAYEAGAPMTSSIRGWMTLEYVATTYRVPQATLLKELELPTQIEPSMSLKVLADRAGISPPAYVQRVQRVVATLSPKAKAGSTNGSSSWISALGDRMLTALLLYGYPALGLTLLLGAIGLPLPDGVATTVAGSLASQGRIDWFWAATIVVIASLAGDTVGYGLGRLLSQKFL